MRRLRTVDPTLVPRGLLFAGIALSVLLMDPRALKGFGPVKIGSLWVFVWLAAGVWSIEVLRGRLRPQRSRLIWYVLAYVAAAGLATLFSITPVVSFIGGYGRYSGFVESVMLAVLFFLVGQLYGRHPERLREVLYALGISGVFASIYLLVQWLGLDPINWTHASGRPFIGTFGNANFAGGYLGATFPWLFWAMRNTRRSWLRIGLILLIPVTVWSVFLTGSRGGLLALVTTTVVALLGYRRWLSTRILLVGAVLAVVGLSLVAVLAVRTPRGPEVSAEDSVASVDSLRSRAWWWGAALRSFADHPIVGTGPDTFEVVWPKYAPSSSSGTADAVIPDQPHNVPLAHAAGMGILGIGAYLLLVGGVLVKGVARLRDADRRQGDLLVTFLAMVCGYVAQSTVSIDVPPLSAMGWAALGASAALCDPSFVRARVRGVGSVTTASRMTLRWAGAVLVVVAVVLLAVLGVRTWLADRVMRVSPRSPTTELRDRLDRGIALNPYEPTYRGIAGDALMKNAARIANIETRRLILGEAVERLKEMDELQPGYHLWKMTVGEALGRLGEAGESGAFVEADIWFSDALDLSHADWRVPARYGEMLNRWGRVTRDGSKICLALEQFERSSALRETDPTAHLGAGISHVYLGNLDAATREFKATIAAREANPFAPPGDVTAAKNARSALRKVEKLRDDPPKRYTCD